MSPKVFNYAFAMFAIRGLLSYTNISFKIEIDFTFEKGFSVVSGFQPSVIDVSIGIIL